MDDGINAIALILAVLAISLFFFVYLFEELELVFLLILIVLVPLLIYTCLVVVSTKWDRYRTSKDWHNVEEIKKITQSPIENLIKEEKNDDS
jgi:L-asparagine transporter-like permease